MPDALLGCCKRRSSKHQIGPSSREQASAVLLYFTSSARRAMLASLDLVCCRPCATRSCRRVSPCMKGICIERCDCAHAANLCAVCWMRGSRKPTKTGSGARNCFLSLQCRHTPSSRRAFAPSPAPWHAQLGLSEPLLCASLVHLLPSISLRVSLLLVVPLTPSRTSHLALSPPLHLSFRHRSGFSRRRSSFSILSSVALSLDHLRTASFLHRLFPSLSLEVFRSFLLCFQSPLHLQSGQLFPVTVSNINCPALRRTFATPTFLHRILTDIATR